MIFDFIIFYIREWTPCPQMYIYIYTMSKNINYKNSDTHNCQKIEYIDTSLILIIAKKIEYLNTSFIIWKNDQLSKCYYTMKIQITIDI